jgi:hypothetical protein
MATEFDEMLAELIKCIEAADQKTLSSLLDRPDLVYIPI